MEPAKAQNQPADISLPQVPSDVLASAMFSAKWSAPPGSVHQPSGVLDENGEYLVITYWPKGTVTI